MIGEKKLRIFTLQVLNPVKKMASIEKESHLKRFDGYCIGFIVHFKNWHTALVSAPTLPYNYKVINKRPNGNPLSHWYRTL
jgi:hypothetical protein